ncbi:MAG TPA: hypothetical protein VGJ21_07225 [Terracidiphilus sp.]
MPYYTRVLTKQEDFPTIEELSEIVGTNHRGCKLTLEEGTHEEWESLLLSGDGEVEIAVLERNPVFDGSIGQDEIAEFIEDTADAKPQSGVEWLHEFLAEVKTVYAFQHLLGAGTEEGSAALHALRNSLSERGDAIIQADMEGFTNEDGYNIVWQFSDTVSGAWNMAVLQDGTWHPFKMDLGDPDHREAFFQGEVPADAATVQLARSKD